MTLRYVLVAIIAISAHAATPGGYVGAQACRTCHPAQFQSQSASAHAGALSRISQSTAFPAGKLSRGSGYRYEILPTRSGLRVHIADGTDLMDLPLEWAFGAGRQATTFVTRVNQEWYVEYYTSFYSATKSYGPTPGQRDLQPKAMSEAAGVLYKIADARLGIKGCFECHSTGPVSFNDHGDASVTELGVHCETCHGPGAAHAADPRRQRLINPAKLSPVELNAACGTCHRPPAAKGVTIDWNYSWNVRHQPVYLSQSRCFVKSDSLSCLTCHDPHEPAGARKPVAFYNQKCLTCHASLHKTECLAKGRDNCIDCHMPLVAPQPPLRFANHWIGIYRTGSKLKPER